MVTFSSQKINHFLQIVVEFDYVKTYSLKVPVIPVSAKALGISGYSDGSGIANPFVDRVAKCLV